MKQFYIKRFLVLEAIICCCISIIMCSFLKRTDSFSIVYIPLELIGRGLRALSLGSVIGNVVAIILYLLLCLIPIFVFILLRYQYKITSKIHYLLFVISGYLAWVLYYFINPWLINALAAPMLANDSIQMVLKPVLCLLFYALILAYFILLGMKTVAENHEGTSPFSMLLGQLKGIMVLVIIGYVGYVFYFGSFGIITSIQKLIAMDWAVDTFGSTYFSFGTGLDYTSMYFNIGFTVVQQLVALLPNLMLILILLQITSLINELIQQTYGAGVVATAKKLSKLCRIAVFVSLAGCIGMNVLTLLCSRYLVDSSMVMSIPILTLILAYAFMILAKYFEASNQLNDDNQMFI